MARKQKRRSSATQDDIDNIVGLFLMTFGQGVNPLHVHRSTVQEIRTSLTATVSRALMDPDWNSRWKADAASVLGWMAAAGRMAAQMAIQKRRSIVNPTDFATAFQSVMAEHDPGKGEPHTLGKWCM